MDEGKGKLEEKRKMSQRIPEVEVLINTLKWLVEQGWKVAAISNLLVRKLTIWNPARGSKMNLPK